MTDKTIPSACLPTQGRTRIRPVAGARPLPPMQPQGADMGTPPPPQQPAFGSFGGSPSFAAPPHLPVRAASGPMPIRWWPPSRHCWNSRRNWSGRIPAQPEVLRQRVQGALIDARDAAVALGQPLTRANQGAWFVAALIDDIALNTPWGGTATGRASPSHAPTGEVDAGTRFFRHLEELVAHPNRDPDLLELAYLCLGLGFRCQYRPQGRPARPRSPPCAARSPGLCATWIRWLRRCRPMPMG